MKKIFLSIPNSGRQLRHVITALLKSEAAIEIKKINYCTAYTLQDRKINKKEEKLLVIFFEDNQQKKLENLILKLAPDAKQLKL